MTTLNQFICAQRKSIYVLQTTPKSHKLSLFSRNGLPRNLKITPKSDKIPLISRNGLPRNLEIIPESLQKTALFSRNGSNEKKSRILLWGAVSIGIVVFLMGVGDEKALALGPEGPLMEEFWENMRRYGLYALTVSTGVLYAVFQPIYELLKNPISAILVLTIMGGSFYIVSQVVSAMVGVTDFSYDYNY